MEWATYLAGASFVFSSLSEEESNPLRQLIGLLMCPFAIAAIIFALREYMLRSFQIIHGAPTDSFASKRGPVFFSIVLMIVLVSSFTVKMLQAYHYRDRS